MLTLAFFLSLCALILQGIIVPKLTLLAFAPFLSLIILKESWLKVLWLSALSGALVDLLSEDPMGLHALNYTLIAAFFFRFRSHLSADHPFHLSLFTALFSSLSTLLQWMLLFLFEKRVPFSGKWVFADLIGMPIIDALYAFVWFTAPLSFCRWIYRLWLLYRLRLKRGI